MIQTLQFSLSVKHNGNITMDDIYKTARTMRPRSMAKDFSGTVKEILGWWWAFLGCGDGGSLMMISFGMGVQSKLVYRQPCKTNSFSLRFVCRHFNVTWKSLLILDFNPNLRSTISGCVSHAKESNVQPICKNFKSIFIFCVFDSRASIFPLNPRFWVPESLIVDGSLHIAQH